MGPKSILLTYLVIAIIKRNNCSAIDDGKCNNFEANMDIKNIVGTWNILAIIPAESFPENQTVPCYKVDFSETDVAGLRWLINSTIHKEPPPELAQKIAGLIIRQRYHARTSFDIWSKAIEGTKGCFEQVLAMDGSSYQKGLEEALTRSDKMQLHILDLNDGSKPVLLQMLWGKLITVVVYSRDHNITLEQMDAIKKLLLKLRGIEKDFMFCDRLLPEQADIKKYD